MKADVPGSGRARSFGFRLRPPTTSSRLLMWFARYLYWLPSHVAGVPAGSLGVATGVSLCLPGRLSVAVVAAHLLLGRVVSLRLGFGWGLWFDVTAAPCWVMAM